MRGSFPSILQPPKTTQSFLPTIIEKSSIYLFAIFSNRSKELKRAIAILLNRTTAPHVTSAALTIWLCNGVSQFTLVVGTDPLHEFRHREHARGFHHRPFPMDPFGFNGIEPGTLAR
jgi:hypothetical protein